MCVVGSGLGSLGREPPASPRRHPRPSCHPLAPYLDVAGVLGGAGGTQCSESRVLDAANGDAGLPSSRAARRHQDGATRHHLVPHRTSPPGLVIHAAMFQNGLMSSLPYAAMYLLSFVFSWGSDLLVNRNILSRGAARKLFNTIGETTRPTTTTAPSPALHYFPALIRSVLGPGVLSAGAELPPARSRDGSGVTADSDGGTQWSSLRRLSGTVLTALGLHYTMNT